MIKHQGSALLSALFIMTLVAIATTTLTLQLKNNLDKTQLLFKTQQFDLEAELMRFWAMDFLGDKKNSTFGRTPGQSTYIQHTIFFPSLPDTHFSAEIIDLNARFNLNNLKYTSGKTTFYRLTKHLLEDEANKKSYPLTSALTNWISDYQPGHEKNNQTRIAHLNMISLSELALIPTPNVDPGDLKPLMPYITALPQQTAININTAPEELLMALAGGTHTLEPMEELIEARGEKGIESLDDIKDILRKLSIKTDDVTLESEYFLSIGQIKKNTQARTVYTLLQRIKNKDDNKKYTINLIHETSNTD